MKQYKRCRTQIYSYSVLLVVPIIIFLSKIVCLIFLKQLNKKTFLGNSSSWPINTEIILEQVHWKKSLAEKLSCNVSKCYADISEAWKTFSELLHIRAKNVERNFSGKGDKATDEGVNKNIDFNLLLFLLLVRRLQTPKTIKTFVFNHRFTNGSITGFSETWKKTDKNSPKRRFVLKQTPWFFVMNFVSLKFSLECLQLGVSDS